MDTTAIILLSVLMLASVVDAAPSFNWSPGPDVPTARDNLAFGVVDNMLVVAGGAYWKDDQKHYLSDTIAYSPKTGKWMKLPFMPKAGAYGAGAVYNGELLIAGGANTESVFTSCFRLAKTDNTYAWKKLPDLPHPVSGVRGAVVGSKFLVISGSWGEGEEGFRMAKPTLLELDMKNPKAWKETPLPDGFRARTGSAAAVIGDRLYVFGGHGIHEDDKLANFVDSWVLDRGAWKQLKDTPVPTRWATALALDSRRIGLFGGYAEGPTPGFIPDVYIYDAKTDTYAKSDSIPLPVCNLAAGVIGGKVYLAGGEDIAKHRASALFVGSNSEK